LFLLPWLACFVLVLVLFCFILFLLLQTQKGFHNETRKGERKKKREKKGKIL